MPANKYMNSQLKALAQLCIANNIRVATAESCTGGMVSAAITDLAGSSQWFDAGFVTYSNEAKMAMLGVKLATLAEHGAVSELVVSEMALGAVNNSKAQFAVSISGIAGPGGGTKDKPVGTVCFAVADAHNSQAETCVFTGDRAAVRLAACERALTLLLGFIEQKQR
jgi:nicotinamide-nucleotide amidase